MGSLNTIDSETKFRYTGLSCTVKPGEAGRAWRSLAYPDEREAFASRDRGDRGKVITFPLRYCRNNQRLHILPYIRSIFPFLPFFLRGGEQKRGNFYTFAPTNFICIMKDIQCKDCLWCQTTFLMLKYQEEHLFCHLRSSYSNDKECLKHSTPDYIGDSFVQLNLFDL